jgi:hypothetical protein
MSLRSSQSLPGASVDGQTVTNWRLIWITTALEVVFVTGLFVTWRLLPHAKPEARAAAQSPTLARVRPVVASVATIASAAEVKQAKLESPVEQNSAAAKSIQPPAAALSRPAAAVPSAQSAKLAHTLPKGESPRQVSPSVGAKQVVSTSQAQPTFEERIDATPAEEFPVPPVFKRIHSLAENELAERMLSNVPEVDIETVKDTGLRLLARATDGAGSAKTRTVLDLLPERADLSGLPLRKGADCQASADKARDMQTASRHMRRLLVFLRMNAAGLRAAHQLPRRPPVAAELKIEGSLGLSYGTAGYLVDSLVHEIQRNKQIMETCAEGGDAARSSASRMGLKANAIATVVQLLEAEELPLRWAFVKLLAETQGPVATAALARRALFDTSETMRDEAVDALKTRPEEEYRQVLLNGLRYPWPPVADHAAEALVTLEDKKALPGLVDLLDQPDPAASAQSKDGKWFLPQLVRINHLRNCVLCHSPSFDTKDLVRAPVPTPGEPLRELYYASLQGPAIRADVTYLRQDFSILQPVPDPGKWPERQRFDYVIRQRELTLDELQAYQEAERFRARAGPSTTYPQRQAVLFALRELTGKDAGVSALAWRKLIAGKTDTMARKPKS